MPRDKYKTSHKPMSRSEKAIKNMMKKNPNALSAVKRKGKKKKISQTGLLI